MPRCLRCYCQSCDTDPADENHGHVCTGEADCIETARNETIAKLRAENARLREALERIVQWSEAYPTQVFPEPDFKRAAAVLSRAGMTLDAISASNMRHATKGVGEIARAALDGESADD